MKDPYRIMPKHTQQELQSLKESIAANGLESPIVVDTEDQVIDGHARRDVCEELHIDWHYKADVRVGLSTDEKKALAITLNLPRRSTPPTTKQRKEYAETLLLACPLQSDLCVASVVGLDRSTVCRIRAGLVRRHKIKPPLQTVGVDGKTRAVSSTKRKKASFVVRSKKEYEKVAGAAHELAGDLQGFCTKPLRLPRYARRKQALAKVAASKEGKLPASIDIQCCDFRDLKVKPKSVDLIATDVVWGKECREDWHDLAGLAKKWLKPNGLFATYIGTMHLSLLVRTLEDAGLHHLWTFHYDFTDTTRNQARHIVETWRPIPVFGVKATHDFCFVMDRFSDSTGSEKDFHDWQQPLPITREMISRLCPRPGLPAVVVDPHLGSGTSAVACLSLPGKTFIGCDIDPETVKIARYRVAEAQAALGSKTG